MDVYPTYYTTPDVKADLLGNQNYTNYVRYAESVHQCDNVITLTEMGHERLYKCSAHF